MTLMILVKKFQNIQYGDKDPRLLKEAYRQYAEFFASHT